MPGRAATPRSTLAQKASTIHAGTRCKATARLKRIRINYTCSKHPVLDFGWRGSINSVQGAKCRYNKGKHWGTVGIMLCSPGPRPFPFKDPVAFQEFVTKHAEERPKSIKHIEQNNSEEVQQNALSISGLEHNLWLQSRVNSQSAPPLLSARRSAFKSAWKSKYRYTCNWAMKLNCTMQVCFQRPFPLQLPLCVGVRHGMATRVCKVRRTLRDKRVSLPLSKADMQPSGTDFPSCLDSHLGAQWCWTRGRTC